MATNAIFYNGKWFPNIASKIKAKIIEYDNSYSSLTSTDLQNAIDELKKTIDNKWETIYPIGAIYLSINDINPGTFLGGTWEIYGEDKYLRLATDGKEIVSDGNNSVYYTPSGTVGSHSHYYTPSGTNKDGSVSNHALTTSEIPSHSHGLNSHTHGIPALSGYANSNGEHRHYLFANQNGDGTCAGLGDAGADSHVPFAYGTSAATGYWLLGSSVDCSLGASGASGSHTHTIATYSNTSYGASGNTATEGSSGYHSHGFTNPTFTGTRAVSEATTPSFTGTQTLIKTEPAYTQIYAWKRIA